MSNVTDEEIKRWTARRKSSLALDIIQDKATVAQGAVCPRHCFETQQHASRVVRDWVAF